MAERPTSLCLVDESNWRTYRDVRLASLLDTPSAFGRTYAAEAAFTEQRWLERLHSGSRTWLAMWGDLPVGSATSYRSPEQGEDETGLTGMWVAGHARGRGVGEALVGQVVDDARARHLARVTLHVAEANAPARTLYARLGFRPTGRQGLLPHDATLVELELARDL